MTGVKSAKILTLIIVLAAAVRLAGVSAPLWGIHSWKQADTASIARNYYENGFKFFYPQIDWRAGTSGHVECEFPAYQYLCALIYLITGYAESSGRLLSIFFSLLTLFYLYCLIKNLSDEKTALWAAFFYAILPSTVYHGRSMMPEPLMLLSITAGLHFFYLMTQNESRKYFWLSTFFIALAIAIKPVCLYIGLPLAFICFIKYGQAFIYRPRLYYYALIVIFPAILWYLHAHFLFMETGLSYGIWGYGTDKWGDFGLLLTTDFYKKIFFERLSRQHLTFSGYTLMLAGLFFAARIKKEDYFFDFWILSLLVYFAIVSKGNFVHDYYQLPLILPAVYYMAKPCALMLNGFEISPYKPFKILIILLVSLTVLSSSLFLKTYSSYEKTFFDEDIIEFIKAAKDKIPEKQSIVLTQKNTDPTLLFNINRKGRFTIYHEINDNYLNLLKNKGIKYIVCVKFNFTFDGVHPLNFESINFESVINDLNCDILYNGRAGTIAKILQ